MLRTQGFTIITASAIIVLLAVSVYFFKQPFVAPKGVVAPDISGQPGNDTKLNDNASASHDAPDNINSSGVRPAKSEGENSSGKTLRRVVVSSHEMSDFDRQTSAASNTGTRNERHVGSQVSQMANRQASNASQRTWNMLDSRNQYFYEKYNIDPETRKLINDAEFQELGIRQQQAKDSLANPLTFDERSQLIRDSSQRVQDALLDALGEEKLAQYIYYCDTFTQRELANLVSVQCLNDGASMSSADIDSLTDILANHQVVFIPQELVAGSFALQKRVSDSARKNTDAVLQDAQGKLTAQQVGALRQVLNDLSHWQ